MYLLHTHYIIFNPFLYLSIHTFHTNSYNFSCTSAAAVYARSSSSQSRKKVTRQGEKIHIPERYKKKTTTQQQSVNLTRREHTIHLSVYYRQGFYVHFLLREAKTKLREENGGDFFLNSFLVQDRIQVEA